MVHGYPFFDGLHTDASFSSQAIQTLFVDNLSHRGAEQAPAVFRNIG
jgi:hypothetical protein